MALLAQENDTCYICSGPITAGIHEVSWARRGDMQGKRYHVTCKTESPVNTGGADSLAKVLATTIEPFLNIQRDEITEELEARIDERIAEAVAKLDRPTKTVYIQSGRTIGTVTGQHEHFDLLMQLIGLRESVYLWGEAGSGKSSAAHKAATTLGLPFYYLALQAQTTESKLMGYMDANGNYIASDFYRAYAHGGVFLLDELELGNGNLLGSLNGALANGLASFPCGITERHPDFVCIATGNTPALGATVTYSDRRALDGAVRDRFHFVEWNTDKKLEHSLAAPYFDHSESWVNWVQNVRDSAKTIAPKLMVTQRASIGGAKLLAANFDVSRVADMLVWRGIDALTVSSVLARHPLPTF